MYEADIVMLDEKYSKVDIESIPDDIVLLDYTIISRAIMTVVMKSDTETTAKNLKDMLEKVILERMGRWRIIQTDSGVYDPVTGTTVRWGKKDGCYY